MLRKRRGPAAPATPPWADGSQSGAGSIRDRGGVAAGGVTGLGGNCRTGCQCPATADHGRPAGPPETANQEEQREIKRLQQELRGKDKALAGAAALLY